MVMMPKAETVLYQQKIPKNKCIQNKFTAIFCSNQRGVNGFYSYPTALFFMSNLVLIAVII
jgi:hypothetical protein